MQKDVTQGESYCLTVYSVPCKVTAIGENNIEYTLLNVSETGQYLFIAPTWKVNISQDDASIVKTFNLAGTGKVGGSGSGFDPASDQTISGAWSFTNTAGLVLGNEVPLVLGQGDDAVKIHVNANGDVNIGGALTAESATINGPLVVNNPNGSAETLHQIYGITRFYQSVDLRWGGWLRGTFMVETGILNISQGASFNCAGPSTFSSTVNANGGINIPLAVGAPTDTGAVNRFYALGLAGAMSALVQPIYLNSSSITVTGSISKASNGTLAGLTQRFSVGAASAGSNAYGSAVIPLIGPNGQFNYSSVCGFSLAVSATAFAKFTFGIGRGPKTNRTGLTMDSYSMIPGDNLATNYGEIIDVTINTPYDTVRKGYEIRVREIFYVSSVGHWQVKTTTVFLPVGTNELMPNGLNRLIYMQSGPPSTAVREEKAALYMELGGGSTNTLFKIASLRGFIAFEAGTGVSTLIIDARNEKTYALSADAGTGTRHLYANGLTNPTYHALEAMAVNAIESEETADFEDINIPL